MIDHKNPLLSAYLAVPYLPRIICTEFLMKLLTRKERSADWIGYGTIEDGEFKLAGKGMAYTTKTQWHLSKCS